MLDLTTLLENSQTLRKSGNLKHRDTQNLQKNLRKISAWHDRRDMLFISRNVIFFKCDYEMSSVKLQNVQCVKDVDVTNASNLKFSQQCKDALGKADRTLNFINKKKIPSRIKDIILPLYKSIVRPHLKYAVQYW